MSSNAESNKKGLKLYAIFNLSINKSTNPEKFLDELVADSNRKSLKPELDQNWPLIFVNTEINMVTYSKPNTAITAFDYEIYKHKNEIITYASNNIQNHYLNLSNIYQKNMLYFKYSSQLTSILFIIGIWSIIAQQQIDSINLSNNNIKYLTKLSYNIIFPFLKEIDFSGNLINDVSIPPCFKNIKIKGVDFKHPIQSNSDQNLKFNISAKFDAPIFNQTKPINSNNKPSQGFAFQSSQKPFDQSNQRTFNQPNQGNFNQSNQRTFNQPNQGNFNQSNQRTFNQPNQGNLNHPNQWNLNQPNQGNLNQTKSTISSNKPSNQPYKGHVHFDRPISHQAQVPIFPSFNLIQEPKEEQDPSQAFYNIPSNQDIPTFNAPIFPQHTISDDDDNNNNNADEEEEEEEEDEQSENENTNNDEVEEEEEEASEYENDFSNYVNSISNSMDIVNSDVFTTFQPQDASNFYRFDPSEVPRPRIRRTLKKPIYTRPRPAVNLSDFQPIQLNIHAFPTHEFVSSFFYDSWQNIEAIQNYYNHNSIFSVTVDMKDGIDEEDSPGLFFFNRYSRNLLLPNANVAIGSVNILRAQRDYIFTNGFKAIPTSCSFQQIANNLFTYVFHGVFEADFINDFNLLNDENKNNKREKEILVFDRSLIIQMNNMKYFISNDNLFVHMLTY